MADIKLYGYKSIIPNQVFGREAEPLQFVAFGKVPQAHLTILSRYRIPTTKEVQEILIKNAQEATNPHFLRDSSTKGSERIVKALRTALPDYEIRRMAADNSGALNSLEADSYYPDFQWGESFIVALNGELPTSVLKYAKGEDNEKAQMYESIMLQENRNRWNLRLKLLKEGVLPSKSGLEYLIESGVLISKVINVEGRYGEYENVADQIRSLYLALLSADRIKKIRDVSREVLESNVINAIDYISQCIDVDENIDAERVGIVNTDLDIENQEKRDFQPKKGVKKPWIN